MRKRRWTALLAAAAVLVSGTWCSADAPALSGAEKVHLDVDVRHCYPHMDKSYEQGYIPKVENDTAYLVLPLTADGALKDDRLLAELVMGENAPFIYANYRKELKKETYVFESAQDAYVFSCEIGLEKQRLNGKYPVDVRVYGYTKEGAQTEFSGRIFITVSDGAGGAPGTEPSTEPPAKPPTEPLTETPATEPLTETPATEPATEWVIEPAEPATKQPPADGPLTESPPADEPQTEPETELPPDVPVVSDGTYGGDTYGGGDFGAGAEQTEKVRRQPRLMVTKDSVSGTRLTAGEETPFTVSLQNMNTEETVYNLLVRLAPSQDLKISTASFYVDRLYPKESAELSFSLLAAANAPAGGGSVSVSFEYENAQGTAYSGTEELAFDIYQPAQAVVEGFSIPGQVYAQETVESSVSVRNLGKTAIYNATVEFAAAGLFATQSVFAGNLEAGASYEGTIRIYVGNKNMTSISDYGASVENGYGQTAGTLTLTYEDADGRICRQTQEFGTVIKEPQIVELAVQKEEEPQTNQWWASVLVAAAFFFLLAVCFLGWRLKKSRDALADLLAAKEGYHAYQENIS